jgi:hypothetical protein
MHKSILAFIIAFLLFVNHTIAQNLDSTLNIFSNNYPQEKTFVHFDKHIYSKGETIWFKAYILDGSSPSTQSKNFYADWYNDNGELIKHTTAPIFQATAKGQFIIPENYTGKGLHVKAYTNWMLNFDSSFLFKKYITIIQNNNQQAPTTIIKTLVDFFPEGGEIIHNIGSFVAFKATNQFGVPIKIGGFVKNNLGEIIDSIHTDHDGMGAIYIAEPNVQQQYTAFYKDEFTGIEHTKLLPTVLANGVAMQVQNMDKQITVTIKRSDTVSVDKKFVKLYATINNQLVYKALIKLINKPSHTLQIPTDSFPTGVLQLTLFNDNYLPLAERIVFIKNENYQFNPTIQTQIKNLNKRSRNVVEINVADTLLSNLSVSITDANIATDSSSNIFSQLLLSGDIKGNVYNPAYYFANNNEATLQHLDLVMLTNGWRKYNWQQFANNKLPITPYTKDSSYLQLMGQSFGIDKTDLMQQPNIILFLEGKDSTKKNLILPINRKGSFGKSNFVFYDSIKIFYSFLGNGKLNRVGEVAFSNGLNNRPSKNIDTLIKKYALIDVAFFEKQRKLEEEYNRLVKLKGSGVLSEVVVRTRKKSPTEIMDEKYSSGMFSGGDAYQFDIINDTRAQSSQSVFNYLQGIVAGLQITQQDGEYVAKWRQATTDFFLNEIRSDAQTIESLSMNEIAYIKVFKPPFFGGFGGSAGGAIAIYTRTGADVKSTPGKGLQFKYLEGYTAYKDFFAPDYEKQNYVNQPDIRTTLYWNPYILTDASKKKVTIEFYNNDVSKKLKIVLCGMNADGKLAWIEKEL